VFSCSFHSFHGFACNLCPVCLYWRCRLCCNKEGVWLDVRWWYPLGTCFPPSCRVFVRAVFSDVLFFHSSFFSCFCLSYVSFSFFSLLASAVLLFSSRALHCRSHSDVVVCGVCDSWCFCTACSVAAVFVWFLFLDACRENFGMTVVKILERLS
jgi:hypothetical protein